MTSRVSAAKLPPCRITGRDVRSPNDRPQSLRQIASLSWSGSSAISSTPSAKIDIGRVSRKRQGRAARSFEFSPRGTGCCRRRGQRRDLRFRRRRDCDGQGHRTLFGSATSSAPLHRARPRRLHSRWQSDRSLQSIASLTYLHAACRSRNNFATSRGSRGLPCGTERQSSVVCATRAGRDPACGLAGTFTRAIHAHSDPGACPADFCDRGRGGLYDMASSRRCAVLALQELPRLLGC